MRHFAWIDKGTGQPQISTVSSAGRQPIGRKVKAIIADFATVLAILVWIHPATAQESEGKIPRIGFISYHSDERQKLRSAFQQGLKDLEYVQGRNIVNEE